MARGLFLDSEKPLRTGDVSLTSTVEAKVHSSEEESSEALVAPLLSTESDGVGVSSADEAATGFGSAGVTNHSFHQDMMMETAGTSSGDPRLMSAPPVVKQLILCCTRVRTAADALPTLFYAVVTNGKMTSLGFMGVYLIFISAWLPFWLLSFAVTEWGVYLLAVCTVYFVGRSIIRMIAFPGASRRVTGEMESEFARYSVRMLLSATDSLLEVVSIVSPVDATNAQRVARQAPDLPGLWRHAKSYRDRVLGVYLEVLLYLYRKSPTASHPTEPDLNKYGNNRMNGDIGDITSLTVSGRVMNLFGREGSFSTVDSFTVTAPSSC